MYSFNLHFNTISLMLILHLASIVASHSPVENGTTMIATLIQNNIINPSTLTMFSASRIGDKWTSASSQDSYLPTLPGFVGISPSPATASAAKQTSTGTVLDVEMTSEEKARVRPSPTESAGDY
ncbi:hypothetical protein BDZ45DRAFT_746118 [Acephala macrosclerotiorum]|nr:hypothetical protein BDZ45DRAFT_746118 [Acephala macrosclerotiorum]